eukprot:362306-Chlamydomonas_euryale.AAC.5
MHGRMGRPTGRRNDASALLPPSSQTVIAAVAIPPCRGCAPQHEYARSMAAAWHHQATCPRPASQPAPSPGRWTTHAFRARLAGRSRTTCVAAAAAAGPFTQASGDSDSQDAPASCVSHEGNAQNNHNTSRGGPQIYACPAQVV